MATTRAKAASTVFAQPGEAQPSDMPLTPVAVKSDDQLTIQYKSVGISSVVAASQYVTCKGGASH